MRRRSRASPRRRGRAARVARSRSSTQAAAEAADRHRKETRRGPRRVAGPSARWPRRCHRGCRPPRHRRNRSHPPRPKPRRRSVRVRAMKCGATWNRRSEVGRRAHRAGACVTTRRPACATSWSRRESGHGAAARGNGRSRCRRTRAGSAELEGERLAVQSSSHERDERRADWRAERLKTQTPDRGARRSAGRERERTSRGARMASRARDAQCRRGRAARTDRRGDAQALIEAARRRTPGTARDRRAPARRGARRFSRAPLPQRHADRARPTRQRRSLRAQRSSSSNGVGTAGLASRGLRQGFAAATALVRSAIGLARPLDLRGQRVAVPCRRRRRRRRRSRTCPGSRGACRADHVVGGAAVAVLYADDGPARDPRRRRRGRKRCRYSRLMRRRAWRRSRRFGRRRRCNSMSSAGRRMPRSSAARSPRTEEDSSARRYARLLVSEIKLYNEAAVRTGREKRDLLTSPGAGDRARAAPLRGARLAGDWRARDLLPAGARAHAR